jgi:uncharacterized membrane protein
MGVDILGIVIGTILVYFLPGFVWTLVIFDGELLQFDGESSAMVRAIERIVLSVGFSLVLVPLTVFVLNVFITIRPSVLNSLLISLIPVAVGIFAYFLRKRGYLNLRWPPCREKGKVG